MNAFHPDLQRGRFIPPLSFGPRLTALQQKATIKPTAPPADVLVEEIPVDGGALKVYRPAAQTGTVPALVWCHGGGYIGGAAEQDDATNIRFVQELGIVVASIRYRLAPRHPSPAATDDAYAGLLGLVAHASRLGVDLSRVAIGGASAGGGLAAGLVLMAHDRGEVDVAFQLMVYPMLDDRTVLRADLSSLTVRVWTAKSNRFAWESYLGVAPGSPSVSAYAAPARRESLAGLPPTWIGVGTLDLFHDEDLVYASRLREAGVPVSVLEVPGAFHGFDALFRKAPVTRSFWQAQADALRGAFGV
jgi:acetyl esterase/lipase